MPGTLPSRSRGWFGTSRYDGSDAEVGAENQEDQVRGRRQENLGEDPASELISDMDLR